MTPRPPFRPLAWPALAWLTLTLAACASSDGLQPHGQLNTPGALPAELTPAADSPMSRSWPSQDWWRALGDPQLDALMQEALQGNPDLAVAEARLRQSTALAELSDAQRAPSVNAQASVQSIRLPGKVVSGSSEEMSFNPKVLGLNASYGFDLWGGQRAAWEAALGRQRAAEVDQQAARLLLSVDLARAYAQLGHAYRALDLAQQEQQRSQQILALTRQRVQAGIDGSTQLKQAEAVNASAEQRLVQARHGIDVEKNSLAVLLGASPERATRIARPGTLTPPALAWPDNLPADLLGRRPDIVAARWRVEAAQRDIDVARTQFYPSFNLTAALGLVSFHADDLLSLRSRYLSLAPAVSLPIFEGGRLRANLAGRDADFDLAVAQYNKALVSALNQVALQMQTSRSLDAQARAQQQAVDAAQAAWTLAMQRYQRGIGSYVEALSVQQTVLTQETVLAQLHHQQVDSAIQLIRALGGGYAPNANTTETTHTAKTHP